MLPRSIVCPDCGETVPSGRSACPSCGASLALLAVGVARPTGPVVDRVLADHDPGDDPSAMAPARIQSQSLPETSSDGAQVPGTASPEGRGPAIPMTPSSIRQTEFDVSGAAGPVAAAAATSDGGYLPPGTPVSAPLPVPAPVSPPPPAIPHAGAAPGPATSEPGIARPAFDLAGLDHAIGYATAAGSGLIAFGMLMPWSSSVIGAKGVSGLFDTWGLAGPGHILVLLWAVAVMAVSILPNRIPVSLRTGLAGLALGVFSLGLVWPYVVGPLGAGIGVLVVTVGGLVLTATGLASAWRDRHEADDRSV